MTQHETSRTLVKSTPELWAECSDAESLARHLGAFGEIRITKLEPETTVAWEGTAACGTVRLEPSGWGTRVTLTVTEEETVPGPVGADAVEEPVAVAEPPAGETEPPAAEVQPPPAQEPPPAADPPEHADPSDPDAAPPVAQLAARAGLFARLMSRFRGGAPAVPEEAVALATDPPAASPAPDPPVASPEPDQPVASPEPDQPVASPEPDEPLGSPEAGQAEEPRQSPTPEPQPVLVAAETPGASAEVSPQGEAALAAALDSLGRAHHRPYSRA